MLGGEALELEIAILQQSMSAQGARSFKYQNG
jgi:hypothetical protein